MHSEQAGTPYAGRYGDGATASRVPASVSLAADGLAIAPAGGTEIVWPYADLRVSDPLRSRSLDAVLTTRKTDPASLYVDDTQFLAALIRRAPHLKLGVGRWRDARAGLAVGALALAGYASLWIFDLSPTKGVAQLMPLKARAVLGDSVIRTMPAQKRCTGVEAHAVLGKLTQRLMPNGPISADNIIVLDWALLNAFAVPGGRIVLTRGLIEQARGPDEIAAVIGHEAGHSIELHPEASLVRSVGFWALVQMVFTGTPGAIGNIGVVLAQLGYTRSAERQADEHALRMMREAHISPKAMADFFRRMEKREPTPTSDAKAMSDILSSHPSNPERIARIEGEPGYEATPALSAQDWAVLKMICGAPKIVVPPKPVGPAARPSADAAGKVSEGTAAAAAKSQADKTADIRIEPSRADPAHTVPQGQEARPPARPDSTRAAAQLPPATSPKADPPRADAARSDAPKVDTAKTDKDAPARQVATVTPPPAPPTPDSRIAEATRRIAVNAGDAAAYLERGQAHAAKHDTAAAIEDFSRALELRPGDAGTLFWRAATYAQRNQADQAVSDYSEVIRLQPRNFAAYNNRGSLYRSQKKLDLALKDYSTAIAIDGRQSIALTNRALVYREQNNLDLALVDLNAAVAANPSYVNAFARRGETLELKSQRESAISDYRTVLRFPEPAGVVSEPHKTARARLTALGVKF